MVELALSDQGYDGLIEGNFATEADVKNFVMMDPALNRWFLLYPEVRAKPLFTHPCKAPFVGGPLASIQTQNRIGAFKKFPSGLWQFRSGQTDICTFNTEFFQIGHQNAGKKSGSR